MKSFFIIFVCALGLMALSACSTSTLNYVETDNDTNPTLLSLTLTNARTGETFSLADFAEKVVYVEPMATWCTNCRHQLGRVRDAYTQLDASQYVFVSISVETNISSDDLATYADNQDFPWIFAVASPDMLTTLSEQYGETVLVPPSTPHFIINTEGRLSGLYTGFHEAPDIMTLLQETAGA
jgi:peroxiredoxin